MASDWSCISLSQAGVSLIDCEHTTPPALENGDGFPYVAIPQIKDGRVDITTARRITADNFATWTRKARPQGHDIVLSRRCNPGETAYVPPGLEFALGQNLVLLRSSGSKIHPPFLRWLVRSDEWHEQVGKFINVGAVFDSLKCADIPKFELTIPPMRDQRRICDILGALDDKIELNRRMNETLEAIARALFKSWFVDFDPVHAKSAGRQPPNLAPALAALFPDRFQDTELGPIPAGWRVGRFDEAILLQRGFDLPANKREVGPYPVVAASGPVGMHSEFMVKGPGVTTGRSGILGNVFYVHEDHWPLNTSLWVKEFRNSSPGHAYHFLRRLDFSEPVKITHYERRADGLARSV